MKIFDIKLALCTLALLTITGLNAQNNDKLRAIAHEYTYNSEKQINFIRLKPEPVVYASSAKAFLNSVVFGNSDFSTELIKEEKDQLGYQNSKYQVYYKNVPVNNAIIIVHSQNGKIISLNGHLYATTAPVNSAAITEQQALQAALNKVNAKVYKWQNKKEEQHMKEVLHQPDFTFYPKGELILYSKKENGKRSAVQYAYKFNIYAEEPLYKANVIVDAATGTILDEQNLICTVDVPAVAATKYSGTQNMTVDNNGTNSYRLRETSRGLGIETYNMQNTTTYSATDFTNNSTNWVTVNSDQVARDAHWGAEKTYDYFSTAHSRNSIDDAGYKLLSYVHYSTNYNNAFWDGLRMTYGDGNGTTFSVLTALDVCGHEITHGLTTNTSNLDYSDESGALNESFSDIFGTLIEIYARPSNWDWRIGKDMTVNGQGIRSMSNPNTFSNPDTYNGTYWYNGTADNGGVHTNSGVSNYWFYLLSQGGSGTNDLGSAFSVSAIGNTAAAQIAYRSLTVYFTPTTDYNEARAYSIQAAKDLFGNCSNEVKQTTNAWYAVGVGPVYSNTVTSNFAANATSICSLPSNVNFSNTSVNGDTYSWSFGDGSVSTSTNPVHTYTANGTFTVKLKTKGCLGAKDSITKTSYITINTPNLPTTTGNAICGAGAVSLSATGTSQLYWYTSPTATGTPVSIGNTYITPSISSNTTYYVVNTSTTAPVTGAPTNTAIGTGGNYNNQGQYQIFDVTQNCTLKSVVVYAGVAGNRTIEIRNSANALVTSTTVAVPAGMSTVNLNFNLTPGTGYMIGLSTTSAINMYRNNAGAVYPYNIGGLVNMTGSSAGGGYYYFFYNWTVQKSNCTSLPVAVTATVNTAPALSLSSKTICAGQSTNLNAGSANTYTWSNGASTQAITVSPLATTVYTVAGSNGGSCNSTVSATVTVKALPVVSVNSPTICSGQSIALTATGGTSYLWNGGQTTSNINVTPAATSNYTVTGTTGTCSNSAVSTVVVKPAPAVSVASFTICNGQSAVLNATGATTYAWNGGQTTSNITVTPGSTSSYTVVGTTGTCSNAAVSNVVVKPVPAVSVNSFTICSGQSASLNATGATTYAWNGGQTTSNITVSPGTSNSYTVIGTTGTCTNSAIANVVVKPTPVVSVNSVTICNGQSTALNATGATTYLWNSGQTTAGINVSPLSTSNYTVTGTTGTCSNYAVSNVVVVSSPPVSATSSTICSGQSAGLTATGATTYSWSSGQTGSNINVMPTATSTYTVYGSIGTCSNTAVSTVFVNQNPTVAVNAAQTITCVNNGLILLSGSPTGGNYSGTGVSGNTFDSNNSAGNYSASYVFTDANGCSNSAIVSIVISPCTGIESRAKTLSLSIYPNPTSEYFIINTGDNKAYTLTLIDAAGRTMLVNELTLTEEKIDISHLAKGIYLIEIKDELQNTYHSKIIHN